MSCPGEREPKGKMETLWFPAEREGATGVHHHLSTLQCLLKARRQERSSVFLVSPDDVVSLACSDHHVKIVRPDGGEGLRRNKIWEDGEKQRSRWNLRHPCFFSFFSLILVGKLIAQISCFRAKL